MKENMDTQKLEDEFIRLIEHDADSAMCLITGMFVGFAVEYMRRRGFDTTKQIKIDGGEQRDITIHAEKQSGAGRTRSCEEGCNGCEECTDYEDAPSSPGLTVACPHCGQAAQGWSVKDAIHGYRWESGAKTYHCRAAAIAD